MPRDPVRLGRRREPVGPVRRRVRRTPPAAVRLPVLRHHYSAVYLSDNGYLNFLAADQYNQFPVGIPSKSVPNAAIYLLWQDLVLDTEAGINYDTIGSAPNRTFVIEYNGMRAGASRLSFEAQLHEDGRIDLLYGPNPANPGDGRNALTGIENETGTDALEISLFDGVIEPNSAIRIEPVSSGLVHGTVIDRNDGLPIAGAAVTATPGEPDRHDDRGRQLHAPPPPRSLHLDANSGTLRRGDRRPDA